MIDELALESRGLRYLDVTPSGVNRDWESGSSWTHWHDLEETLAGLAATHPSQVDGYRRYAKAALPAARLILEVGAQPPTLRDLTRLGIRRRFAGLPTVMRWSRRSAADVLRGFFDHDALIGPALVSGPMVWGVSPELPGTGLGALVYAMRHVARVGRPVGGSGSLTEALRAPSRRTEASSRPGRRSPRSAAAPPASAACASPTDASSAPIVVRRRPAAHVRRVARATSRCGARPDRTLALSRSRTATSRRSTRSSARCR